MAGSIHFSIEESENFKRSFKKLAKAHKNNNFVELASIILEDLIENQYPQNSWEEPIPRKIQLPSGWTFHKLGFTVCKGASGQIRLMYLVDITACVVKPMWIYSHEQFAKRPPDPEIRSVMKEILDC